MQIRTLENSYLQQPEVIKNDPVIGNGSFTSILSYIKEKSDIKTDIPPKGEIAQSMRLKMLSGALSLDNQSVKTDGRKETEYINLARLISMEKCEQDATNNTAVASNNTADTQTNSSETEISSIIERASRKYGLDSNLIKAVIKAESNFNPFAVSPAGAQGMMQLMPATASSLGVTDSFNLEQNIMAGTRYLKDLMNRYGGNQDKALAAYNWGPGNVDKGTGSLPLETRNYLTKVNKYYSDLAST